MAETLLRAELHPPITGPRLAARPRRNEQIAQGVPGLLTLMIDPAANGKTTLDARRSLDKEAGQLERFRAYLLAAAEMLCSGPLPGAIPATGNTNTRCRFPPDVSTFVENWSLEGPTHHFALGVGHIAHLVEGFCRCFGLECVNVTDPAYRRAQYVR